MCSAVNKIRVNNAALNPPPFIVQQKEVDMSKMPKSEREASLLEAKLLSALHHPNIVGFEHFFEDHENVYILLEMCTN